MEDRFPADGLGTDKNRRTVMKRITAFAARCNAPYIPSADHKMACWFAAAKMIFACRGDNRMYSSKSNHLRATTRQSHSGVIGRAVAAIFLLSTMLFGQEKPDL